jgi:hypothetical protein
MLRNLPLAFACLLPALILALPVFGQPRTIGVVTTRIISESQKYKYLEEAITDSVIDAFLNADFQLVERSKIDAALQELALQESGLTSSSAVKLGKFINANYIAISSATQIGLRFTLSIRLVDVESAKVTRIGKETGGLDDLLDLPAMILKRSAFVGEAKKPVTYMTFVALHTNDFKFLGRALDYAINVNGVDFHLYDYFVTNREKLEGVARASSQDNQPMLAVFFPVFEDDFSVSVKVRDASFDFQTIKKKPYIFYTSFENRRLKTDFAKTPPRILGWGVKPVDATIKYLEKKHGSRDIPFIIVDQNVHSNIRTNAQTIYSGIEKTLRETRIESRVQADWRTTRLGDYKNVFGLALYDVGTLDPLYHRENKRQRRHGDGNVYFEYEKGRKRFSFSINTTRSNQTDIWDNVSPGRYRAEAWGIGKDKSFLGIKNVWVVEKEIQIEVLPGKTTVIEGTLSHGNASIRSWTK